jgi:hypothetical protein
VDVSLLNSQVKNKRNHPPSDIWPKGTAQSCTRRNAKRFFDLLGSSHQSLLDLLRAHPELPPYKKLQSWRANYPWFAEAWRNAREQQGEYLVQRCLAIANATTPKNAHAQRVKFDIYWKVASKFFPSVYGDKPTATQTTNVQIGFSVSAERLNEIRSKLEITREALRPISSNGDDKPETLTKRAERSERTKGLPLLDYSRTDANNNDKTPS